jgi:sialate O-acetylesterase
MKKNFLILALFVSCLPGFAELKLPFFFSDGMVLQQQMQVPIWGKAIPFASIQVFTFWNLSNYKTVADEQGNWKIKVQTPSAGGPYRILIKENKQTLTIKDVMIGEVWILAGQSNMEMPLQGFRDQPVEGSNEEILNAAQNNVRWFKVSRASTTVPLDTIKPYTWKPAASDNLAELSATGWFFAKTLSQHLKAAIGVISCNYGGSTAEAWMRPEALAEFSDYKILKPGEKILNQTKTPTTLYNGMLHPLIGYGIKGVIWYQGESNYMRPERYEQVFPKMVKDWRQLWDQGDFPFYYVQIAPFDYPGLKDSGYVNSAYLRDVQRKVEVVIPNSGMAVIMDGGDSTTIHPRSKNLPGERLALLALAKTYGLKGVGFASPKYQSMEVKGSEVTLTFDDAPLGLSTFGKLLTTFEIAGEDKVFHKASAKISAGKVVVTCAEVPNPVAVRYAFKDFVVGSLFGANGLPVSSFRTDNW